MANAISVHRLESGIEIVAANPYQPRPDSACFQYARGDPAANCGVVRSGEFCDVLNREIVLHREAFHAVSGAAPNLARSSGVTRDAFDAFKRVVPSFPPSAVLDQYLRAAV